ncbi:MAG: hypothetical protein Q8P12_07320 [bacterium]|nr:hypothetical protein [bacterium]
MATKLVLRDTQTNGVGDGTYFDMLVGSFGVSTSTAVVDSVSGGTDIPWTQTAGGSRIRWISGRVPAGGFTLTTSDLSIWAHESNANANAGGSYTLFVRNPNGVETEIPGGPFDDGVEFTKTTPTEMTWAGDVTDTALAEDDRLVLEIRIDGVGTMGANQTCTLTYNGADGADGDSFLNLNETVAFKAEAAFLDTDNNEHGDGYLPGTVASFSALALASTLLTAAIGLGVANADPAELPEQPTDTPGTTEDYWQVVQETPRTRGLPYIVDEDFVPLQNVPDEDSARIHVPAWEPRNFLYLPAPDEIPGGLSGQPDEDYWQNPVSPVPASLYQPLPSLPDVEEPTAVLWGEPVEDYWKNPVFPVQASVYQKLPLLPDGEEPVPPLTLGTDEDYWLSPVPVQVQQARNGPLLLWDAGEIGIFVIALDEDYWVSWVHPIPASIYQPLPYLQDREQRPQPPSQPAEAESISVSAVLTMSLSARPGVTVETMDSVS